MEQIKDTELVDKIKYYALWFKRGVLSEKVTTQLCQPLIDRYNKIARKTARKYNTYAKCIELSDFLK